MDDFEMKGDLLRNTLDKIAKINRRLGGNRVTMNALKKVLRLKDKNKSYTILDIGCGGGDMLREIADYGEQNGYNFELVGIDANADTIDYAKSLSKDYKNINYRIEDILQENQHSHEPDIVLCTLFLHHFDDKQCELILNRWFNKSRIAFIVNDLQRSALAYYLFKLLTLFISNPMVKNDGLVSILRSFKKEDLVKLTNHIKGRRSVRWMWAFRYQMILEKGK